MGLWRWIKGLFGAAEIVGTLYSWWHAQALFVPALLSGIAAVSAWNLALPAYQIALIASAVFAAGAIGVYYAMLFSRSVSPKHKLKIMGVAGTASVIKIEAGRLQLLGATCELRLRNDAEFPIRYILADRELVINKTVEDNPTYDNAGVEMSPMSEDGLAFHQVTFPSPIEVGKDLVSIKGQLAFTLVYGRPGRERYYIRRRLNLYYSIVLIGEKLEVSFEYRENDPEAAARAKKFAKKIS